MDNRVLEWGSEQPLGGAGGPARCRRNRAPTAWTKIGIRVAAATLAALAPACSPSGLTREPAPRRIATAADTDALTALAGTWRGDFHQTAATGDSGAVNGDIECEIAPDGTYRLVWTTRQAAGSARAGRMEQRGTVVAKNGRVEFDDVGGATVSLTLSRGSMYGIWRDPAGRRATVSVDLERVPLAGAEKK